MSSKGSPWRKDRKPASAAPVTGSSARRPPAISASTGPTAMPQTSPLVTVVPGYEQQQQSSPPRSRRRGRYGPRSHPQDASTPPPTSAAPMTPPGMYYMAPPFSPLGPGMGVPPMGMPYGYPPYGYPMYGMPPGPMPMMDRGGLLATIRQQVDFYFSLENLIKDVFLRQRMDCEGYVPAGVIMSFHRVARICSDVPTLLEAMEHSVLVEVDAFNEKLRAREGWAQWLFPQPDGTMGLPLHVKAVEEEEEAEPAPESPKVAVTTMSPPGGSSSPPRVAAKTKPVEGEATKAAAPVVVASEEVTTKLQALAV